MPPMMPGASGARQRERPMWSDVSPAIGHRNASMASYRPPTETHDTRKRRHMGRLPQEAPATWDGSIYSIYSIYRAGTIETIFGALTMIFRGSLPPRRDATASRAMALSSAGSMSGLTSSFARTLPATWTTAVTVS